MSDGELLDALNAEDILDGNDTEIREVHVPEWKRTVFLRSLPADEALGLNDQMQALSKERTSDAMFLLLRACLVTRDGLRLITSDEQAQRLRNKNAKVLLRLQQAALELQGWVK